MSWGTVSGQENPSETRSEQTVFFIGLCQGPGTSVTLPYTFVPCSSLELNNNNEVPAGFYTLEGGSRHELPLGVTQKVSSALHTEVQGPIQGTCTQKAGEKSDAPSWSLCSFGFYLPPPHTHTQGPG